MSKEKDFLKTRGYHQNVTILNEDVEVLLSIYAREQSITLLEWLTSEDSPFAVMYGAETRFATDDEDFTSEQVVEKFITHQQSQK